MKAVQIDRVAFSSTIQQTPAARRVAGARRALRVSAVADVHERVASQARQQVSLDSTHNKLIEFSINCA